MKKIFNLVICFIMLLSLSNISVYSADDYSELFQKDKILDINIEISENDLEDIYTYAGNEEYHSADITVNGIKVENAGIRTKGNMTLKSLVRSESDRYSYRIKFNKYVKGNKLLGLDELCLNNGYSDPSYMREYLHYEILEQLGMAVPERAFCRLYINGENAGFYLAVVGLDSSFLKSNFGDDYKEGNFYKMDEGATLQYKENENYTYADLKSGDDTDLTEFKSFIEKLNNLAEGEKGNIEDFLDVDSALKYIASNTVLSNYDSYNGNMHHNYYLYENKNGVFTVVPWDFNMSFGGFNGANSTVGIDTPIISQSMDELPLINKLLSIPEYKEKYYDYIKEIMNILSDFEERVSTLKSIISPYVQNDTTAFYTYDEFEKATTYNEESTASAPSSKKERGNGFGSGISIINCVKDRLDNIEKQFSGTAEKETIGTQNNHGQEPPNMNVDRENDFKHRFEHDPFDGENGMTPPPDMPDGNFMRPDDFENVPFPDDFEPHNPNNRPDKGMDFNKGEPNNKNTSLPIRVHVNGHIIDFETEPYIKNDSTLVGFRSILEALGADVVWDNETKTVTAVKEDIQISMTVGSNIAYINGEKTELNVAPELTNNSTMIPLRFISEKLGMNVGWNESTRLITVTSAK